MLISFSFGNFLSFRDKMVLSMDPSKSTRFNNHLISASKGGLNLLKCAVIYGANASGKSNLVKAFAFFKFFVTVGTKNEKSKIPPVFFLLDEKSKNFPSRFEIEIKLKNKSYAYGFTFVNAVFKEEWLYDISTKSEKLIFFRKTNDQGQTFIDFKNIKFKSPEEKKFLDFTAKGTRGNLLFLTECINRNVLNNVPGIEVIKNVYDWIANDLKIIFPDSKYKGIEFELMDNKNVKNSYEELLKRFDTYIDSINMVEVNFDDELRDIPDEVKNKIRDDIEINTSAIISSSDHTTYFIKKESSGNIRAHKLITQHKISKTEIVDFEVSDESDGTQRILDFIPMILDFKNSQRTFIIDELDRSLHTNLSYEIINLLLNEFTQSKSQIILTTHDTGLLSQELLRKDEIWFVKRGKNKSSELYSLDEFKPRFDKDIRKDYLDGRYGAIPNFPNQIING